MRPLVLLPFLLPLATAQAPGDAMVHVVDHGFRPSETNSTTGTVVVMSFGPSAHTFTADDVSFHVDLPAPPEGEWTERSLVLPPRIYPFHCEIHPNMTGVLRVAAPQIPTTEAEGPGFGAPLAVVGLAAGAAWLRRRG